MLYECMLTLCPKMYSSSPQTQFTITSAILKKLLKRGDIKNISIVAELTKTFNVHYHCLVDLATKKDCSHFLTMLRPFKQFGKKSLDVVMNEPAYRDYMCKDIAATVDIIENCPIVTDGLKVFINRECLCSQYTLTPICPYKMVYQKQFALDTPTVNIESGASKYPSGDDPAGAPPEG